MRKEFEIALSDLKYFSVACEKCGTSISVDLDSQETGMVEQCPHCHRHFGDALRSTIYQVMQAIRQARGNPNLSFRVPAKD